MEYVDSYYTASTHPQVTYPQLNETIRCDVCVVGGGFSGLSCALHLVEAGYDVVLLEAARIGWGASGRNGGLVINSYSRDVDVIEARYGSDTATMLGSMMFAGAQIIRHRIDQYAIACDYRPGAISAALTSRQFTALREKMERWQRYGNQQLELLDGEAIRRAIASERYVGGLLDLNGGHLHPLNLAIGEAEAVRRHGGRLFEQSAVTHIDYSQPATVHTKQGSVSASFVILAGNAYLGEQLAPRLSRLSIPCGSQIITTAPLSPDRALTLLPDNYCVEDCNYLLDYFRLTADNRLLYGSGVAYGAPQPASIEAKILPKMLKTFPQLKNIGIDYRWSGNFSVTLSHMPQFGRLENNVYYLQGDNGHGVTLTHLAGKLIAEVLRGDAERFDAFAKLPHLPFFGGRHLQIPFTLLGTAYYALRDRLGF